MKLQKSKSLLTTILTSIIIISIFIGIFLIVLHIQNKHYIKIINAKINLIVNTVVKNYPDVNEEDILKILNTQSNYGEDILKKYGYDNEVSNIKDNVLTFFFIVSFVSSKTIFEDAFLFVVKTIMITNCIKIIIIHNIFDTFIFTPRLIYTFAYILYSLYIQTHILSIYSFVNMRKFI